jgi:hypothetical protein
MEITDHLGLSRAGRKKQKRTYLTCAAFACWLATVSTFSDVTATTTTDTPKVVATVQWADPQNPNVSYLGDDQYLLATNTGMQVWDATQNAFHPAKGWPALTALDDNFAVRLEHATPVVGSAHDTADIRLNSVIWWDRRSQAFLPPLVIPTGQLLGNLIPVAHDYALACIVPNTETPTAPYGKAPPFRSTRVGLLGVENGVLRWIEHVPPALRTALAEIGVRGEVEGAGKIDSGFGNRATSPPVIFDTGTCQWELPHPPAELANADQFRFKHYRLPDGRVLLGHASFFFHERGWIDLSQPYLWDEGQKTWHPIAAPAQGSDEPYVLARFGIGDSVISVGRNFGGFVEFLDTNTLHWLRSQQLLPKDALWPRFAPRSDGTVVAFLRENGQILIFTPMHDAMHSQLAYDHPDLGNVALAGGGLLLLNGGNPEWLSPSPTPQIKTIAPLPVPLDYVSGVELKDKTILAFGGLPRGQSPENLPRDKQAPLRPAYLYIPDRDKWEEVLGLNLKFAPGAQLALEPNPERRDARVRQNGDFVYLDWTWAGDMSPASTTLWHWHKGSPATPLAALKVARTQASLLELNDGRLVVVGGLTVKPVESTPDQCIDCADQPASTGSMVAATTTEIFDESHNTWVAGPIPQSAGGRAWKLANGQIFKLAPSDNYYEEDRYTAELANAAFTHWQKLPAFPIKPYKIANVAVVGNRIIILPATDAETNSKQTVVWDGEHDKWTIWNAWSKTPPTAIFPIDSEHVIARHQATYEVVALPDAGIRSSQPGQVQ